MGLEVRQDLHLCPADSCSGGGAVHGCVPDASGKSAHLLGTRSFNFYLKLEDETWMMAGQVWGHRELVE